jgi:hypothetical protein
MVKGGVAFIGSENLRHFVKNPIATVRWGTISAGMRVSTVTKAPTRSGGHLLGRARRSNPTQSIAHATTRPTSSQNIHPFAANADGLSGFPCPLPSSSMMDCIARLATDCSRTSGRARWKRRQTEPVRAESKTIRDEKRIRKGKPPMSIGSSLAIEEIEMADGSNGNGGLYLIVGGLVVAVGLGAAYLYNGGSIGHGSRSTTEKTTTTAPAPSGAATTTTTTTTEKKQ